MTRREVSAELLADLLAIEKRIEAATTSAAAARQQLRREFDPGHIYVIEFDSGVIKVGKTADPVGRLRAHGFAGFVRRSWFSERHIECGQSENALLAFCRKVGQLHGGREYFVGLSFERAQMFAEALAIQALLRMAQEISADRIAYLNAVNDAAQGDTSTTWLEAHLRAFGDVPIPGWATQPA